MICLYIRRAHEGDGGYGGDQDVGERHKTAGRGRNAMAGDLVGSRKTEERGFGDRNGSGEGRRATATGFSEERVR